MENGQNIVGDKGEQIVAPSNLSKIFEGMPEQGNVKTEEPKEEQEVKKEEVKEEEVKKEEKKEENEFETKKEEEAKEEKEEEEGSEDSIVYSVANRFEDVDLSELEVEDSEEGLLSVVDKIVEQKEKKAEVRAVENLFTTKPILKTLSDHLDNGGSLMSLIQRQAIEDYDKVEIKEDDLTQQEGIYRRALQIKGVEDEEIDELVGAAKDGGNLLTKSKNAKDYLVKTQKEIVDKQLATEQEEYKKELAKQLELEKEIKGIIKTGKVNGLELSPEMQTKLEEFNFKVDKEGKTERERKYDSLTSEQWVMLDALVMSDFKQLGAAKPTSQQKKSIKLTLKKSTPTVQLTSKSSGAASETLSKLGVINPKDFFTK